jgi:hypothetical protein
MKREKELKDAMRKCLRKEGKNFDKCFDKEVLKSIQKTKDFESQELKEIRKLAQKLRRTRGI